MATTAPAFSERKWRSRWKPPPPRHRPDGVRRRAPSPVLPPLSTRQPSTAPWQTRRSAAKSTSPTLASVELAAAQSAINPIVAAALVLGSDNTHTSTPSYAAPEGDCSPSGQFAWLAQIGSVRGCRLSPAPSLRVVAMPTPPSLSTLARCCSPQRVPSHDPVFSRRGWQRRAHGCAGWHFARTYHDATYYRVLCAPYSWGCTVP